MIKSEFLSFGNIDYINIIDISKILPTHCLATSQTPSLHSIFASLSFLCALKYHVVVSLFPAACTFIRNACQMFLCLH